MTRIELGGVGTPVIDVALPEPGAIGDLPPQVFNLPNGASFDKTLYVDLGYTHFEVLCIGAAGGRGGSYLMPYAGGALLHTRSYGGGGGGGGLHRVLGLLSDLPDLSAVVVGSVGADGSGGSGAPSDGNYIAPTAGGDGGASTFNGTTCRASGGKGGSPTPAYGKVANAEVPGGDGGAGGAGDRTTAGGGAAGGTATATGPAPFGGYVPYSPTTVTDGDWDGSIGQGGGGGVGGTWRAAYTGKAEYLIEAGSGSRGSFDTLDPAYYGQRETRSSDSGSIRPIVPGSGGGAKNGSSGYGSHLTSYSPNGLVLVRLYTVA